MPVAIYSVFFQWHTANQLIKSRWFSQRFLFKYVTHFIPFPFTAVRCLSHWLPVPVDVDWLSHCILACCPIVCQLSHGQMFHCIPAGCPTIVKLVPLPAVPLYDDSLSHVFVDVLSHFQQSVPLYMLTGCLTVYIICLSYYVICLSLCLNKLHIPPFTHKCCICICLPTLPHKMLLSEQFPSHSNSAVCHTVYPTQPSVPPAEQLTPMSVSC